MSSNMALKIYSLIKRGIIKSNAQFWREFSFERLDKCNIDTCEDEEYLQNQGIKIVCYFDNEFPRLPINLKQSERPFLFAYKGNLNLLNNPARNIAIIGLRNPSPAIVCREQKIVEYLKGSKLNIVSGLALGCDTIAHEGAIRCGLKTIAFLPSTIEEVYPSQNRNLAVEIVKNSGLIITEYTKTAKNRFESIARFVARDRLQAMFSKAVLLIASNKEHEGDSGSQHAMNKAQEYGKQRLVMFNPARDSLNHEMMLNKQYFEMGTVVINKRTLETLIGD